MRRGGEVRERGLRFMDCGTSGGVWGLDEGYSLMIGGDDAAVERAAPDLRDARAGASDRAGGTSARSARGHFAKMVHNGIEYGMMQAYAEGFSIMQHKTEFALDLAQIAEIWRTRQRGALVAARPHGARARGRIPTWTASRRTWPTPARAAGRWPRRSTSTCRRR